MPWLKVEPGQVQEVVIKAASPGQRRTHWVDRQSKECTGPGCALCAVGSQVKVKWTLPVVAGMNDYTWEFPDGVRNQLIALLGDGVSWLDKRVAIRRFGSGLDTRYQIEKANGGAVPAAGGSLPADRVPDFLLEAIRDVMSDESYWKLISQVVARGLVEQLIEVGVLPPFEGE